MKPANYLELYLKNTKKDEKQKDSKALIFATISLIITLVILYLFVVDIIWLCNNPCANEMTFFTHFNDAIHFRSLPQFQEKL